MKVTVWSVLSGKISGHLVMNVPATQTVCKVLNTYCSYKGVSQTDGYVMRSKDNLVLNPNKTLGQAKVQEGDTLTIGLLEDEQQTFAFGSWWMVTLASFTIGMLGLVLSCWLFFHTVQTPEKFGIVVDAGSSHSEAFLFTWDGEKPLKTADVKLSHRCFIIGGISNYATHADDLGKYFGPCINEIISLIPSNLQRDTPIYVGATAGMRILRYFDQEGADLVLLSVREFLERNTTLQVDPRNIGVISGFEEGIGGWIAVNYMNNQLKQHNSTTAITLDVGGASVQVTSEVTPGDHWKASNVTLFNHTHIINSQSYLCFGIHEAFHRYSYLLVMENETDTAAESTTSKSVILDPCLAKGVTRDLPVSEISGPCTLTKNNTKPDLSGITNANPAKLKKIFKNYIKGSEGRQDPTSEERSPTTDVAKLPSGSLTIQGSGDAIKCEERVKKLFDYQSCNSTFTFGDCMDSQSLPPINWTLVAFSGIFEHLTMLLHLEPNVTLAQYKKSVFDTCSLNVELLFAAYPGFDKELVEDLCFDGMFLYSLMTSGLGINKDTWSNVQFTTEINKKEVVWPQGFMINRTSSFPSQSAPASSLDLVTFTLLLLLFAVFILSGILFLNHSHRIRNHSASYQRVIAEHIDMELHRITVYKPKIIIMRELPE
ncbi:hypothetical protein Pmani_016599 [Petrolisthes manimaculis]|uniref:Ectonucleoside triphosphate diphosphohydrolase 2 n=1 Tax=Petrolisthes manimaculis TaxID=1843537 RepID=A0AAE1PPR4_9EUCA|nr:hypothetical protein Pmani_016599 [Petrolisthes manimaculis]